MTDEKGMAKPEVASTLEPFSAVVLCGGSSRRMGTDKAWVEVDGRPIVATLLEVLTSAGASQTISVGGDRERLLALGYEAFADRYPGEGPLGGVITGLRLVSQSLTFLCAVDLPWLSAAVVRGVITAASARPAPVTAALLDAEPQLLTAAYRAEALLTLEAAYGAGERSLRRAVAPIAVAEVAGLDPKALRDVDTPGDLRSE
jgi:molybdenum cofactor guanylyltransferase